MSRKQHIDNLRAHLTSSIGHVILDDLEQYEFVPEVGGTVLVNIPHFR